jgi:hypothetical protein
MKGIDTEKAKNYVIAILLVSTLILLIAVLAFFFGRSTKEAEIDKPSLDVSSQSVVDRINDQYFVVTKTMFISQDSSISINQDSSWNKILWGKEIEAEGLIRIDIGVDMTKLSREDVTVDEAEGILTVNLPEPEILNSSLEGDLEVETKSGVLETVTGVFKEDTEEYNLAKATLIDEAESVAREDEELFEEAERNSLTLVRLILEDLNYDLEIE